MALWELTWKPTVSLCSLVARFPVRTLPLATGGTFPCSWNNSATSSDWHTDTRRRTGEWPSRSPTHKQRCVSIFIRGGSTWLALRMLMSSSKTVSRFLSRKPSHSYCTCQKIKVHFILNIINIKHKKIVLCQPGFAKSFQLTDASNKLLSPLCLIIILKLGRKQGVKQKQHSATFCQWI